MSLRPVFNKKKVLKIYLIIFTGPVGVAAAAAIASAKKRKHHYSFETNPSVRKRQQNRLLRKLRVSSHSFQNISQFSKYNDRLIKFRVKFDTF